MSSDENIKMIMGSSVQIDGNKIRQLREEKGLTQLYLATVVGVTTDTISRWENRRYPTIKKENGLKLAEALEVELEEILETNDEEEREEKNPELLEPDTAQAPKTSQPLTTTSFFLKNRAITSTLSAGLFLLFLIIFLWPQKAASPLEAFRIVPAHTPPGVAFPVVVKLRGAAKIQASILVRETISGEATASVSEEGENRKEFGKKPRWIGKTTDGQAFFLYMVHPDIALQQGDLLTFSGNVVTQNKKEAEKNISGPGEVTILPYHWADSNKDYIISDDEILQAYDTFPESEMQADFHETLETLWLADKYTWNNSEHRFETPRHNDK